MLSCAKWIRSPQEIGISPCPVFARTFRLTGSETGLSLAVTCIGIYRVTLNGISVSDALFAPGFTDYQSRLQVQTYNLLPLASPGENRLEIQCANGWAVGFLGRGNTNHIFADHISLAAELSVTEADGKVTELVTDECWGVYRNAIRSAEFYHGETDDFTAKEEYLGNAVPDAAPAARLIPDEGVPVREIARVHAKALIRTPKGETVIDFGQNLAGYAEITVTGAPGDRVTLSHAETLDREGNFYTKNLELAECRNTYVLDGTPRVLKPHFTFQGYRYIRIDEFPAGEEIRPENFVSVAICSDMKETGFFLCGNEKVNRLYRNTLWGQRSNFIDIPTDCPQRDERLGWLGDAQVFIRTAAINYDVKRFFTKWLNDVMSEQNADGGIYGVVPKVPGRGTKISAAWGDATVICPWELYRAYGDRDLLARHFPMMQKWVEFIRTQGPEEYLWLGGDHYGDWLAADAELSPAVRQGATQTDLIASAYFAYVTQILVSAGEVLGMDMQAYRTLHGNIRAAFRKLFMKDGLPVLYPKFDGLSTNRRVIGQTQTAIVLILHFGLYEGSAEKEKLTDTLLEMIRKNGGCMATGFVGTPYLLHVLTETGHIKEAYNLFLQEKYPSWLFSVNRGATTIWEHWDGIREDGGFWDDEKNSFNHYSYGCVFDWVFGSALGINPAEPAYRRVRITPHPDRRLGFAAGSVISPAGKISVSWHFEGGQVRYEIDLPDGIDGELILPDGQTANLQPGKSLFYGAEV